ncbi:MAG: DUF4198 domain-containing protein [Pyrinomonadaceae bacterium MAG19_C2-C3]|nr:DUF4198 domain-containing protein [Pyrinomonadaceae bacterium MAG19_C2-C3]
MLKSFIVTLFLMALSHTFASPSSAHDYWLEPDKFFIEKPSSNLVALRLHLGDHFTSEVERPTQRERAVSFDLFSRHNQSSLLSNVPDGTMPVANLSFEQAGTYLVTLERTPARNALDGEKFTTYLREEGLNDIIALRRKSGEATKEGREEYRRYLKTLIQVGKHFDDFHDKPIGFKLEITLRHNPYRMRAGDKLPVRVTFDGAPLAGVQVAAYNRQLKPLTAKTNMRGEAVFALTKGGAWLVRLVYMRRCANCADGFEWESFWGSYSFAVGGA